MDCVGHVPPRRLRPRVGGGGVVVPHPAPQVHPHGVGPADGHLPLEEGEAAERAEEPAGGGVVLALHPAVPGRPPRRVAPLLPPHGRQVPARCVGAGVRPGGARVEDLGVPPLQGLAHSGPLGPELGAAGALDGGHPAPAALRWWPVYHHPFQAPAKRSWRGRTPGSSPTRGARAHTVLAHPCCSWGAGNTKAAWQYHQRTRARPWCPHWCQVGGGRGGGGARAACPRPRPRPRPCPHPLGPCAIGKKS